MNILAIINENKDALNTVYNVAFGERTTLNQLYSLLKKYLGEYDAEIRKIEAAYGPQRKGDVPHSLASIEKAKELMGYKPEFDMEKGLQEAVQWYWQNLK